MEYRSISMEYGPAKLSSNQLHQLKQTLGTVLTLLSVWALFSLDIQSEALLVPAALLAGSLVIFPSLPKRIPERAWRIVTPVLIFIVLTDFITNAPEFIPSLVRMVVWLLIYRNLAPRSQREDMQLILLCLFCVVLSGVLTVSLLFALEILLFTPMAMILLFLICLTDKGKSGQKEIDWEGFHWKQLLIDLKRVVDFRVAVLTSLLFGFVVTVSTVLFILTPRFNLEQAIPFLELPTQARSGFSDVVQLGDVSEISEDDGVAVRIDVPSIEAVGANPYWRMLVLDNYENGAFQMSANLRRRLRQINARELPLGEKPASLRYAPPWTFYVEGGISRFLPVPGKYAVMRFQAEQKVQYDDEVKLHALENVKQSVFSYQLAGLTFPKSIDAGQTEIEKLRNFEDSSTGTNGYPETTVRLELAAEDRQILNAINQGILDGRSLSAREYAHELEAYLLANFSYSLNPDGQIGNSASGRDPIVHWLSNGTRGHCELFAGAFVLLAREFGFPTRMVVGFAGGAWNGVENYFLIRNSDAHAWVEIYDPKSTSWVRMDPTSGTLSQGNSSSRSGAFEIETGWDAWLDSLRIQWYRRVVNFEQDDQIAIATGVQRIFSELSGNIKDRLSSFSEIWKERFKGAGSYVAIGLLALLLSATLVLVFLFWRYRHSCLEWLNFSLNRKQKLSQMRKEAGRLLKRLEKRGIEDHSQALLLQLQEIRYGPNMPNSHAREIFSETRKLLRTKLHRA